MRNIVVCLTQSTLSSQSDPKTQLRALGELRVSQLGIGIGIGNISTLATFTSVGVGERNWRFENLLQIIVVHLTLQYAKFAK